MIKNLLIISALSTGALSASAQWTLSGGHIGDRQFTEKTSGIYELSLPGETIYGKFLLKNGDDIRYGAENTYVCGGVAYTLATSGDSLTMASSIVSPVLTLDTNTGTLTATGDIQPLYLFGNFKGNYYKIYKDVSPEAHYEGNGIYKATNVQMHGNALTVCQEVSPNSLIGSVTGDYIAPYRFSAVEKSTLKWNVPAAMEPCVRMAEKNFTLPEYFALIDVTVNMIDVTFEVTPVKLFNLNLENLYIIGSNIASPTAQSQWNDTGCPTGLLMDKTTEENVITFSLNDVAIRPATTDSEDPRGEIEFTSNLGSWDNIYSGYLWGWNLTTDTLTLNTDKIATAAILDTGKWTAPYSLPTGKYDITVIVQEKSAMQFRAVQTSTSAIEAVEADATDCNTPTEWYDLEGRRIAEPTGNGIYLRRQGRQTQKVWIFNCQ